MINMTNMTKEELKTFETLLEKTKESVCNFRQGCPLDCPFYCESNGNSDCALDRLENWCEGKKEEIGFNIIESEKKLVKQNQKNNQLEVDEINRLIFALSNLQDDLEMSEGITPTMKIMHQRIERKLKKQKEILKNESDSIRFRQKN